MARNRMIRPEFWEDSKVAHLSPYGRLFFIALWNFADDEGYIEHDELWLKAKCFPYDRIKIAKLISELEKSERIEIRNKIIHVKNFLKYQKIEKARKSSLSKVFGEQSGSGRGAVGEGSTPKDKLSEVKLSEVKLSKREEGGEASPIASEIISDLNLVLGTNYKSTTPKTRDLIKHRLNEGFGVEDFKTVHRKMLKAWGADQKMSRYLRPVTLYGTKFENYLNLKEPTTKLTENGIKAYYVGQEWLRNQELENVG